MSPFFSGFFFSFKYEGELLAIGGLEHERYSETEMKREKKRRKWEQWLNEGQVSRRGKGSDG